MILFTDTETTGFYQDNLAVSHPSQPHIVQLAAQLCDDEGSIVAGFSMIIDPGLSDGVRIPEKAAAVHGVTEQKAAKFGVSSEFALSFFMHLYQHCDVLVAHNLKFDKAVIETALSRHHGLEMRLDQKAIYCTMEQASPVINLPPTDRMLAAGFDKPKPPKLEECIRHFFDEDLSDAHDALVDLTACQRVYFHLKAMEAVDADS